mgnify:CR=1 FL=1
MAAVNLKRRPSLLTCRGLLQLTLINRRKRKKENQSLKIWLARCSLMSETSPRIINSRLSSLTVRVGSSKATCTRKSNLNNRTLHLSTTTKKTAEKCLSTVSESRVWTLFIKRSQKSSWLLLWTKRSTLSPCLILTRASRRIGSMWRSLTRARGAMTCTD